jgi:hypothetical protein
MQALGDAPRPGGRHEILQGIRGCGTVVDLGDEGRTTVVSSRERHPPRVPATVAASADVGRRVRRRWLFALSDVCVSGCCSFGDAQQNLEPGVAVEWAR